MNFLKTLCIFLVCLAFLVSKSECNRNKKLKSLCGSKLTQTLMMLCSNGFYSNYKRSAPVIPEDDSLSANTIEDEDSFLPFSPNFDDKVFFNKGNMLSNWRAGRAAGIVRECCQNQCSINTLLSYCD
ncbi:ins family protein [Megaselia abdita]